MCEAAHLLGPVPSDDVAILLDAGGASFQPQVPCPSRWRAQDIAAGDLDGDLDLVVTDRVWHLGAAYLNRTVQID
jgi:hypothetical protein